MNPTAADFIKASDCARFLAQNLAIDCALNMQTWDRETMQKNVNQRAALLKACELLLNEAERIG